MASNGLFNTQPHDDAHLAHAMICVLFMLGGIAFIAVLHCGEYFVRSILLPMICSTCRFVKQFVTRVLYRMYSGIISATTCLIILWSAQAIIWFAEDGLSYYDQVHQDTTPPVWPTCNEKLEATKAGWALATFCGVVKPIDEAMTGLVRKMLVVPLFNLVGMPQYSEHGVGFFKHEMQSLPGFVEAFVLPEWLIPCRVLLIFVVNQQKPAWYFIARCLVNFLKIFIFRTICAHKAAAVFIKVAVKLLHPQPQILQTRKPRTQRTMQENAVKKESPSHDPGAQFRGATRKVMMKNMVITQFANPPFKDLLNPNVDRDMATQIVHGINTMRLNESSDGTDGNFDMMGGSSASDVDPNVTACMHVMNELIIFMRSPTSDNRAHNTKRKHICIDKIVDICQKSL